MWPIFRLHQFPLSNIKKTYQAFPGILEIYLHQHEGLYMVLRYYRTSCDFSASDGSFQAFGWAFRFLRLCCGLCCGLCGVLHYLVQPKRVHYYRLVLGCNGGPNHSTLTSENDHCCKPDSGTLSGHRVHEFYFQAIRSHF